MSEATLTKGEHQHEWVPEWGYATLTFRVCADPDCDEVGWLT